LKTQDNKKCRDTKRLIRIAIENGMTNQEIAAKAGLSKKSVAQVSRWRNGEALAFERQMRFFIKEFGDQLRRKSEHLLCVEKEGKHHFIKITGELVLKHTARVPVRIERKQVHVAIHRFLIFQKSTHFYVVSQARKGFEPEFSIGHRQLGNMAHCDNEDANWISNGIPKLLHQDEIMDIIDSIAIELAEGRFIPNHNFKYLGQELRYCLRRYLMKEGYTLSDVIDISNKEEIIE
jgi:DNA-binding XRE family transcriptional regulator